MLKDTMKLRFKLNPGLVDSILYLKNACMLLSGTDGIQSLGSLTVKISKTKDLAFIQLEGENYKSLLTILKSVFDSHEIVYRGREKEAPYGIHIQDLSKQTNKIYEVYKGYDLSYADQELDKGMMSQHIKSSVTGYHLKKDEVEIMIKRKPEGIQWKIGEGIAMTSSSLNLNETIDGLQFNEAPLVLNTDMNETEFEAAIEAADIKIESRTTDRVVAISSESFPAARLQKHFIERSTLLVEDVISWIKQNVARLSPKINMLNAALLAIQASQCFIQAEALFDDAVRYETDMRIKRQKYVECFQTQEKSGLIKKGKSLSTESYAWQTFAACRAQTDARKCHDETCISVADRLTGDFRRWMGDSFDHWAELRENNLECFIEALKLFEAYPPKDHQPLEMAYSGQNRQQYSRIENFFKSEAECKEIEEEESHAIRVAALEQKVRNQDGLVIRV